MQRSFYMGVGIADEESSSSSAPPLVTERIKKGRMLSFFHGKPAPTTSHNLLCFISLSYWELVILLLLLHPEAGSCKQDINLVDNVIGCMPFSQKYLTGCYIEKHTTLQGTDIHGFLDRESCFHHCERLAHNTSNLVEFSDVHRHLVGEGSHRRLISTVIFNIQSDVMSWFDAHFCEAVVLERLPVGIFADTFELQHLVQHKAYLDAAVFGDTNLELPSALSNQSIVEVHMDIEQGNLSKCCEIVIELPLHARYPPLDTSGYSRVEIGAADFFMRCRPKSLQLDDFSWTLAVLNVESVSNVTWLVPCGMNGHTGFVSAITFVSALLSSLLIVYSAMYCSIDDGIKNS